MSLPLIGITMGDPTGVGPEIILKALSSEAPFQFCRPIVLGDGGVLLYTANRLGIHPVIEEITEIPESGYGPARLFVSSISHLDAASLTFGRPDRECGEAMVRYVEEGVRRIRRGTLQALTTCPINKQAINAAGHLFSGHTELLAHLAGVPSTVMMFVGTKWKVVLVTTHLPLREVSVHITLERLLTTIRLAAEGLKFHFGIPFPKMAILGLNPHCGEEGLLGEEERNVILPAMAEAKSGGINVEGPFPADSFFHGTGHLSFDVVVSMYHDQGLIPIKMSEFSEAVNFTLGLPFIRTSVGHGTAYDIAGKGTADPTNLVRAMAIASNIMKSKPNYRTEVDKKIDLG
jgi:4-phospho-D-threonate 3-dehydrogenase / 4-phospho-D-erythronate 3-dehydrogenase